MSKELFYIVLNLVLLIYSFSALIYFLKNKKTIIISATLFSLYTTLQISSIVLIRKFINYSFFIHFNLRDISAMIRLYVFELFLSIILIIFFFIFFKNSNFLIKKIFSYFTTINNTIKEVALLTFIVFSIYVMSMEKGILKSNYELISTLTVNTNNNLTTNLKNLGINDYTFPDKIEITGSKKNIIIISLESLERGYLKEHFSHLTPNLRALKSNPNWNFFEMEENLGGKWTSGSLYTTLTGFPAFFGLQHNSIFQSSYKSNITSVFNILNKGGYKSTYLVDDATVSGTEEMLYSLGVSEILDKKTLKKIQDKDLFEKAKILVKNSTTNKAPFALYISTLSTHNPNGIYDKRMEEYLPAQKNNLEFMVSSVDWMINDFIQYLSKNNLLSNTVIYILPDHLKHGSSSMFDKTGKRGLYLITNASTKSLNQNDTINQIDLPKIILKGAEINHNAKFLTDYIKGDQNDFTKKNITEITKINISGFLNATKKENLIPKKSVLQEKYRKDKNRFIAHAGGMIDGHIYTNSLESLNSSYNKGFRFFELDIRETLDNKFVAVHNWEEWGEFTNQDTKSSVTHKEFMKNKILGKYTPLDMSKINKWFLEHPDAVLVTDKINKPKKFSSLFIDKNRLIMELFTLDAVKEAKKCLINSIIISENVLKKLPKNKIEILKKYNIDKVAMSRYSISENLNLLKKLKKNNIKVFLYHINRNTGKDEQYIIDYELDYAYGIYADNWTFKE